MSDARYFLENEKQFQLGMLPTEQSSPLTREVDKNFAASTAKGVRNLQMVDRNVAAMAKKILAGKEFAALVETGTKVLKNGGRIVFSGCGATGRLSILLEAMWREAMQNLGGEALCQYGNSVFSIMTGGDYALIKSVEFFEDYSEFGRQQVREMGMTACDLLVAITEGGETSSVLGTVAEATERGARCFLLFNNPAELLRQHLERCRQAIDNPAVTVLDLSCGPMALAGSTRMQATSSEQLIAGAALEKIVALLFPRLINDDYDFAMKFSRLLDALESDKAVDGLADYIDFEAELYNRNGMVTYFADHFLLDIFTDTTERSPTFNLPPFRKNDDTTSAQSWAFVKNPLFPTPETWQQVFQRAPRCLDWRAADYVRMNVENMVKKQLPQIHYSDLMKFEIGNEPETCRKSAAASAAVLLSVGHPSPELLAAFDRFAVNYKKQRRFSLAEDLGLGLSQTPLRLMEHMALKLVLNTISTGTMIKIGRVAGNWMSHVTVSNKKLIDRAVRLLAEIGGMPYEDACHQLFAAKEEILSQEWPDNATPSIVPYVLKQIKRNAC